MTRLLALLLVAGFLLPLSQADIPRDETLTLNVQDDGAGTYLSLCRINPDAEPAAPTVDACTTSGVYEETNGRGGLQVRGGVHLGVAYAADSKLLP